MEKKSKNSKFRNTGIIFELLIRQVTSDTMAGDDSQAINIIKKYFNKTELYKEYKLYQSLINSKNLDKNKAEILINTILENSTKLNRTFLKKEKYNLIKEIKEKYNLEEFFKSKINNYKEYASIYNLIEAKNSPKLVDPQQIIQNKITLLEHITKEEVNKEEIKDRVLEEYMNMDNGTRILAYRILLEKFNQKYNFLENNQKIILKEYINCINNSVKLKNFINTNYESTKKTLIEMSKIVEDPTIKIKLKEVISLIKPFEKNQSVKDDDIIILLQYNQLINELKTLK